MNIQAIKPKQTKIKGEGIFSFLKKNAVMCIAFVAALVTALFVPPDAAYIDYFDFRVLTCLFCVLAVVCALKDINFFYMLARRVVEIFKTARMSVLALVYIAYLSAPCSSQMTWRF